ncbi:MAG: acyloxyacyl hydrolase [Syntrophales bacterium]
MSRFYRVIIFFLTLSIIGFINPALAEETGKSVKAPLSSFFTESGFITGMGTGSVTKGDYEPILLIWHLAADLKPHLRFLGNHRGTLSFICEPQINPAFNPDTDVEFGVGFGLKYMYPVTDRISPYVMGSVGPHFITVQDNDQATGFIFADTIGAGVYYHLTTKSAVHAGYRFRHMSNAGLKSPNSGINTHFGTIGYSVFF